MNLPRPCSGMSSDASRSGAGQPPVRSASWCPSVGCQARSPMPSKKRATSVVVEAQRVRPDLHQVPARAQPRHPEGRVRPGGDHQLDPLRAVAHELGEQRADLGRLGAVVVVEDQDRAGPSPAAARRTARGSATSPIRSGPARIAASRRLTPAPPGQRRGDVRPEPLRLAVAGVQRHPGEPGAGACGRAPTRPAPWSCRTRPAPRPA